MSGVRLHNSRPAQLPADNFLSVSESTPPNTTPRSNSLVGCHADAAARNACSANSKFGHARYVVPLRTGLVYTGLFAGARRNCKSSTNLGDSWSSPDAATSPPASFRLARRKWSPCLTPSGSAAARVPAVRAGPPRARVPAGRRSRHAHARHACGTPVRRGPCAPPRGSLPACATPAR